MPTCPDFDQIARDVPIMSCEACAAGMRRVADGLHYDDANGGATWGVCRTVVAELRIAEQLRLVWNARGAFDSVQLIGEDWLNGWPRLDGDVLMGTDVKCAGCGRARGVATVAFPEGYVFPVRDPIWPFESASCPICKLRKELQDRPQVTHRVLPLPD